MSGKTDRSQLYSVSPERNSVVYIADLVRALEQLQPANEATRVEIARMLGFTLASETPITEEISEVDPVKIVGGEPISVPAREHLAEPAVFQELPPPPKTEERTDWLPVSLEVAIGDTEGEINFQVLPPSEGNEEYIPPAFEPLFSPPLTRSILSGALATESGDGPLDLEVLVQKIARREPLERLPRLAVPTLRRGVQLLVDKSEAMVPFLQDQYWLENRIREVVGEDLLSILPFAGLPTWNSKASLRRRLKPYAYPPAGTLILLMTDLGISQLLLSSDWASDEDWGEFLSGARRAGCPVLALVPYRPSRWPAALTGLCKIVQWDRGTTSNTVRNTIGIAHEVRR